MAVLGTPSSREAPDVVLLAVEPRDAQRAFRAPELPARGPGLGEALAGALGDQVALDLGEQREEGGHDFGLDVALAIDADVLLHRHEGDFLAKIEAAKQMNLTTDEDGKIHYPDARIEYENEQGSPGRVDVEVTSDNYRNKSLQAKLSAGFKMYANGSAAKTATLFHPGSE